MPHPRAASSAGTHAERAAYEPGPPSHEPTQADRRARREAQRAARMAHTYHTRRRELGLMAVTPNILILRLIKLFYRAILTRFSVPHKGCPECGWRRATAA